MDHDIVTAYTKLLEEKAALEKPLLTQPQLCRQYETALSALNGRLNKLEQAARLIGHGLDRRLSLLKLAAGMDQLSSGQKARSISFADAMNAIEGAPASEQVAKGLSDWLEGKVSYLSVFEATLQRYGFSTGPLGCHELNMK